MDTPTRPPAATAPKPGANTLQHAGRGRNLSI